MSKEASHVCNTANNPYQFLLSFPLLFIMPPPSRLVSHCPLVFISLVKIFFFGENLSACQFVSSLEKLGYETISFCICFFILCIKYLSDLWLQIFSNTMEFFYFLNDCVSLEHKKLYCWHVIQMSFYFCFCLVSYPRNCCLVQSRAWQICVST